MSAVRTMYISFILKSTLPSTVSPNSPCYPWVNWRGHPCLGTTQRSTQRGALVQIIPCGSGYSTAVPCRTPGNTDPERVQCKRMERKKRIQPRTAATASASCIRLRMKAKPNSG
eukprot:TRINITY_DN8544_c0_g1_i6.p1 TRINITY_DN8544_c0_g1~~TRINITY_DN8544_c0_g1_i6.p1  ORF type:complete len:114 (-),score=10.80 TRINITY_DN8544_c0_g1_i6:109-450(-)